MNITTIVLIFTLLLNAFITYLVYKSNPKRLINCIFSYLGINILIWNLIILFIVNAKNPVASEFWIRGAFITGSLVTLNLIALVYSIGEKNATFLKKKEFLFMVIIAVINFSLGFFPSFVKTVTVEQQGLNNLPHATYGWPFALYFVLFAAMGYYAIALLFKKLKTKKGLARAELQYILLGCFLGFTFVILCNFVLHLVLKTQILAQFSPLGVIILNGIIGYGIAKYKIMDVSVLMQKIISYFFLILFIFIFYNISLFSLRWFFASRLPSDSVLPDTLVLLIIVFIFEPTRRKINNFVNFSIFNLEYSQEDTLKGLEKVLYTVGDIRKFLEKCLKIVLEGLEVKEGILFFAKRVGHSRQIITYQSLQSADMPEEYVYPATIEQVFYKNPIPLIKGELERRVPEEQNLTVIKEMQQINMEIAIPLLSENKLFGILCFGEKVSGKFFSPDDEEVFERLSYYLSLKVQNFIFYEQLERERIYQETFLENLPIGVIGVDDTGHINIINKEAEAILFINKADVEKKHFNEALPDELRKILSYSIQNNKDLRYLQFKITKGDTEISLNTNTSLFYNKEGDLIGAQVIFLDVTHLEELEEGIKRAERLASLGVMATGIAHEIKNPLVSIKTFAQLLQEKYNDKDFREQFASLAIKEVDRINVLVEDILAFAKPRSVVWDDVDVKELVKATIVLVLPQFPDKKIEIKESFFADSIVIKGDADRLKQALLNVCINSVQAIQREGIIEIDVAKEKNTVNITIRDNGCGIKKDVLGKVFEPFFTTKAQGTGLGLSIVARIIDELKGEMRIASVEGKGATVFIKLPIEPKESVTDELFGAYNGK